MTSLNSNIGQKIFATGNKKGVANDDNISITLNVEKSGIYLLQFFVCHCGADSITKPNACWEVNFEIAYSRRLLNIPISCAWDNTNTVIALGSFEAGTCNFAFKNRTGIKTDSMYMSTVGVIAYLLKSV